MAELILEYSIVIFIYMSVWFVINRLAKNNGLIDIAWGLGFVVIAIYSYIKFDITNLSQFILIVLPIVWGLRLSLHILYRNITKGFEEDWRYAKWRKEWISKSKLYFYTRSFLQINLLQGLLMLIISTVIYISLYSYPHDSQFTNIIVAIGLTIWVVGFIFEAVSDWQLSRFKSNPTNKGKLMTKGLWSLTRHPNYFGEIAMWWGIFIIALNFQLGIITLISPMTITYLLLAVSGITMLEKRYLGRQDFEEYKYKTPALIPRLPRIV